MLKSILQQAGISGGYEQYRHGDDAILKRQRPVGFLFFSDENVKRLEQGAESPSSVAAAMEETYVTHAAHQDHPLENAKAAAAVVKRLNHLTKRRLRSLPGQGPGYHAYFAQYTPESRGTCDAVCPEYDRRYSCRNSCS